MPETCKRRPFDFKHAGSGKVMIRVMPEADVVPILRIYLSARLKTIVQGPGASTIKWTITYKS